MHELSIEAPSGTFRGTAEGGVRYFHSIPYSHIPSRFADAEKLGDQGIVDAREPQPDAVALTITTPEDACDAPVIVYIHGGRFESGTHEDPRAEDSANARAGIVEVQLGYRVGLAGLAKFPEDEYFRYRAIDDAQLGLEWIQRNIEAFGGDPTNVTLVGQSAGATIGLWLARRDHYRGAFRRLVALSPCYPREPFEARKATLRQILKVPITRAGLDKLTDEQLAAGYAKFRKKFGFDMALGPYPLDPTQLADIPIVLGSTREEFANLGERFDRAPFPKAIGWYIAPKFGMRRERFSTWADLAGTKGIVGRLIGDGCIRRWVELVGHNVNTWMVEFVRDGNALHCQELRPLFGVTESPLTGWLQRLARTGEPGFEPYHPEHAVWRFNLDTGEATTTYGALDYVGQAFQED